MLYSRKFANLVIGLLSLWAIYAVLTSLAGAPIIFPMASGAETGVPMSRLAAIRHAVFVTFAFYGIIHLLQGSKEVYPVHFLKTFLFFLGLMGVVAAVGDISKGMDVPWTDWAIIIFFIWAGVVLHFASAPKYRRVFGKR